MTSSQIKPLVTSIFSNIDKDLEGISFLKTIQEKFGIKPSQLFLLVSFVILFLALFQIFADVLTTLFGMMYPAYMSWKAIEKGNDEQKNVWLTYWIVFGSLSTIDDSFKFILDIIPGFYALRFIVFLWMFYPRQNNGAKIIYLAIKPLLQNVKQRIEQIKATANKAS